MNCINVTEQKNRANNNYYNNVTCNGTETNSTIDSFQVILGSPGRRSILNYKNKNSKDHSSITPVKHACKSANMLNFFNFHPVSTKFPMIIERHSY